MCYVDLNLIVNIFQILASIATVGAFLFLFKKNTEQQQQIDELGKIAKELLKINVYNESVRKVANLPDFHVELELKENWENFVCVSIINKGGHFKIDDIRLISKSYSIYSAVQKLEIPKNTSRGFFIYKNDSENKNMFVTLYLTCIDAFNNKSEFKYTLDIKTLTPYLKGYKILDSETI